MISETLNYNLSNHNTFGLHCVCNRWLEYSSTEELKRIMSEVDGSRYFHIGSGGNVILPPHLDMLVLHSTNIFVDINRASKGGVRIKAGAGAKLDDIIDACCHCGVWGFENLSLIPGEAGASVVQNVGAYGVEIADLVEKVECYDVERNCITSLSKDECMFGYRDSLFKSYKKRFIVTSVTYRLPSSGKPNLEYGNIRDIVARRHKHLTPAEVRKEIIALRRSKLPDVETIGSAGSFFKNPVISTNRLNELTKTVKAQDPAIDHIPSYKTTDNAVKIPAAWLIDQCGLKGKIFGNVAVWNKQPLVLVNNTGHATYDEIKNVSQFIVDTVYSIFGIKLTLEVEFIENCKH